MVVEIEWSMVNGPCDDWREGEIYLDDVRDYTLSAVAFKDDESGECRWYITDSRRYHATSSAKSMDEAKNAALAAIVALVGVAQ